MLLVGLGNPGLEHAATRHNVGALVADVLADRIGARFRSHRARADVAEGRLDGRRLIIAEPRSFMNVSGGPVAGLLRFYSLPLSALVVVHDDLDLDFGLVRLKRGGGDGGHNGLRSISAAVGRDYLRVRFGIGRPPGRMDPADYVLRRFSAAERRELELDLDRAADAATALITEGLEPAQNRFHPLPG